MDQIKIGKFIKECRKKKELTQLSLADYLLVSPKTISKWECGKGLPDPSLMIPLCEILEISVNELLSGCFINQENYENKAEENLISLLNERKSNKEKLIISFIVFFITFLGSITLILLSGLLEMKLYLRILLICIAIVIIISGISTCCILDYTGGYFKCPNCKESFIQTKKDYIFGLHTFTKRKLTCPYCHKTSYCKKKLSK